MKNKIAKERREQYEKEIKEICEKCSLEIVQAKLEFLGKKRQARHDRTLAIALIRRKFES